MATECSGVQEGEAHLAWRSQGDGGRCGREQVLAGWEGLECTEAQELGVAGLWGVAGNIRLRAV